MSRPPSATESEKPIFWVASSKKDLLSFPEDVRSEIGHALSYAQLGERSDNTRVLRGFQGASVLEIIEDHQTDTYRAVYTVRFAEAIYVLHCFQKKSHRGIATDPQDMALIRQRLAAAEEWHKANSNE